VLVAGSLLAGCGGDDGGEPVALAIEATSSGDETYSLGTPESIEAGLVRLEFTNSTQEDADVQLLRIEDGHTIEEALEIVSSEEGAPTPDWLKAAGGVGTTKAGETRQIEIVLEEGTYHAVDTGSSEGEDEQNHAEKGGVASFEVSGGDGDAELPDADATIEMNEYSFVTEGLKAGTNRFVLRNAGDELHHTIAFALQEGATIAQVREFFTSDGSGGGPPPLDFESFQSTAVLDAGGEQIDEFELEAGRYAFVCFVSDRAGGPPHVAKGMLREVEVS
jgi:hypothetical protein